MYLLLSGEGPADLGSANGTTEICEGADFRVGPLTLLVDQIAKQHGHRPFVGCGRCGYVSERSLTTRAKALRPTKKSATLGGKKRPKETIYFRNNARALAVIANEKQAALNDPVVAILFRDCDGTASSEPGLCAKKRDSMLTGFDREGFDRGVPMLPKPKSEAWLICALTGATSPGCDALEERSGNDASPNSLKNELLRLLKGDAGAESLCDLVRNGTIGADQIPMKSFTEFRKRLEEVLR